MGVNGNGFRPPPTDGWDAIIRAIESIRRRLDTLERPSNTGDVFIAGDLTVSGSGGTTSDGGLRSLDARNFVTTGGVASYVDASGHIGIAPSTLRYKDVVGKWSPDILRLFELRAVLFRYKTPLEGKYLSGEARVVDTRLKASLSTDIAKSVSLDPKRIDPKQPALSPLQLGWIAEEMEAAGFSEFLFYDTAGRVEGINYDRVTVALLELARFEHDANAERFTAMEARLAEAEKLLGITKLF